MKLGSDEIFYMRALESITGVSARGCVINNNSVNFLVAKNKVGLAVGKKGAKIKKVKDKIGKNVLVFEYVDDPKEFVKRAFANVNINEIKLDNKKRLIISSELEDKKMLLQNLSKLKNVKEVLKRNYGVADLRFR